MRAGDYTFGLQSFTHVQGLVKSVSNGANGVDAYTYIEWGTKNNCYGFLQMVITNTTVSIEQTEENSDTLDASAKWTDITEALTGVQNFTTDTNVIIDSPLKSSRLRIKHTPSSATNTFQLRLSTGN